VSLSYEKLFLSNHFIFSKLLFPVANVDAEDPLFENPFFDNYFILSKLPLMIAYLNA
jgi:hypothetical protein